MRHFVLLSLLALALLVPSAASASPYVQYGVQDDAWLEYGPGALSDRLDRLQSLGVDIVRVTLDWRATEPTRGKEDWSAIAPILQGLNDRHISVLLTLYGTPGWANGGRAENWAPAGSGPFFGMDPSAYQTFLTLYPSQPVYGVTDGAGAYNFSLPGGTIPSPFPIRRHGPSSRPWPISKG